MPTIHRTDEIAEWIAGLDDEAREAIYKSLLILREIGPLLGRPHADSVKGSSFPNMKELRVQNKGRVFRMFFASAPDREAIILLGGNKRGDKTFYERMIPRADALYRRYLDAMRRENESKKEKP